MFTGIVEDKGRVTRVERLGSTERLGIWVPDGLTELSPGDSINVNGACLTVVERKGNEITVDVSGETLQKTTFDALGAGDGVNLERALRLTDRLGGHLVTGHIDGVGRITDKQETGDFLRIRIQVPGALAPYIVRKGSIAVDGISLTVNECRREEIELTLIPLTLQRTTLIQKKEGDRVNLETDLIGKYVEKLLLEKGGSPEGLTRRFLSEHGFIRE